MSHEELREALGAYALGQLDAAEHEQVREHLAGCDACAADLAEIQPVVAALRGIDPDAVLPAGMMPPPGLDDRIRRALPPESIRDRRWPVVVGAALAAAAAAAVVTAVVVRDTTPTPTVIAVPQVQVAQGVTATAGLVDHTWGVEIKLQATGLRAGERFTMWVVADDGSRHEAGEILGVADTRVICDMSSSVLLDEAASFRVVDAAGDEVIAAEMPS
ncbi:anti-sigma factor family protein [Aeromicrobium fastidiosum]|uniref:Anti-sigma factor n=1 Tax=Aeromicrobium fastidiosum TaxID=52699 RepID=A0A641AIZ0_9ACTN|nr:zf-HC2 domain-containing protein [Aeromicrobium fastidiosum]KAA1374702.1 anti-sigma factor [Aeromicrobium fastidiosum]MBP2390752.1 anti-sigma-K factor RskA [Aeromicrobium fastidiosum]